MAGKTATSVTWLENGAFIFAGAVYRGRQPARRVHFRIPLRASQGRARFVEVVSVQRLDGHPVQQQSTGVVVAEIKGHAADWQRKRLPHAPRAAD